MVYEFIATLAAAFALAGIALIIRHLAGIFKYKTPKWLIPVFAASGIFMFQIHQEYNWYEQTAQKLPSNINIVKKVETSFWYKPWSYIKPQTVRFMAIDTNTVVKNNIHFVNLFLFERRMSAKQIPQLVDCKQSLRADHLPQGTKDITNLDNLNWQPLLEKDPLLISVCS